jgi:hypothetical protein
MLASSFSVDGLTSDTFPSQDLERFSSVASSTNKSINISLTYTKIPKEVLPKLKDHR